MKPSLAAHVSNLCRELLQARNNLEEFTARTEELIGVLKEHIIVLRALDRRRQSNRPIYIEDRRRSHTVH